MIVDPVTCRPTQKISEALEVMANFRISGVPVVDDRGKLVGILTNRDLRFETRMDLPISERMTKENLVTCPPGTTLEQAKELLHRHRIEKLLVVDQRRQPQGPDHGQGHPEADQVPERLQGLARPAARGRGGGRERRSPRPRPGARRGEGRPPRARLRARAQRRRAGRALGPEEEVPVRRPFSRATWRRRKGRATSSRRGADAVKIGIGPGLHLHDARRHRRRRAADPRDPRVRDGRGKVERLPRRRRRHQVLGRRHEGARRGRALRDDRQPLRRARTRRRARRSSTRAARSRRTAAWARSAR